MNRHLHHLQTTVDGNVPVHIICNGIYFPDCKVVCAAGPKEAFGLIVSGGMFLAGDRISVGYVLSPYSYTFQSDVVGVQTGSSEDVLLYIRTPDRIARFERRKWSRTKPSEEHPVAVTILLESGLTVHVNALEMSLNGIGFSMPCLAGRLRVNSRFLMTIGLPKLGNMEAAAVVRTVTEIPHSVKYGAEFDPLPEFDSPLAQCLYLRKVEVRAETKSGTRLRRESILVMMKDTGHGTYAFACPEAPVKRVDDLGSISEIVSVDVIDFLEAGQWADSHETSR